MLLMGEESIMELLMELMEEVSIIKMLQGICIVSWHFRPLYVIDSEKQLNQLKQLSNQQLLQKQASITEGELRRRKDENRRQEELRRRKDENRRQEMALSFIKEELRRLKDENRRQEMALSFIKEELRRREDENRRQEELRRRKDEIRRQEMELSFIKEELRRRKDENRRQLKKISYQKNGSQQFRSMIPTKLSLTTTGRILLSLGFTLLAVFPTSCESNTVECSTEQYVLLGERAVVKCDVLEAFPSIYWYNNTKEDAIAFIQKVNGEVAGVGYTAGDFDIDNEGSLVINNVKIRDERTFRVRVLDSVLIGSSYDITLFVYAEPAEPLPEIPECSGQSTCILKGESDRVISCIHGQSRPAMEVSWFLRDGREDRPLNATMNQMLSADSVTFTTSAQLAMEEIPIDANMNQLLVLVCKSHQFVPGMKGTERKILLDNSVNVPFTNEEYLDPAYAFERQEDFKIKCQSEIDTTNNVVLWMYKSLNSENFVNILYSAYGEVAFTTKGEAGFNITDDGSLVVKAVDRQHEGYYACVSNLKNTTVSFVQNLEVVVLPKPARIVVEGCEPFQPCHLSAQEAETITCTVNGVRPLVDLRIVTYSMNADVTYTAVNSHKEGGLFYTRVEGHVDVSQVTCGKNVTVICQASGPAAYGFMSDAYVTIPVDGNECIESSTLAVLPNDDSSNNHSLKFPGIVPIVSVVLTVVVSLVLAVLYGKKILKILCKWQQTIESNPHQNAGERENTELGRLTEPTILTV